MLDNININNIVWLIVLFVGLLIAKCFTTISLIVVFVPLIFAIIFGLYAMISIATCYNQNVKFEQVGIIHNDPEYKKLNTLREKKMFIKS